MGKECVQETSDFSFQARQNIYTVARLQREFDTALGYEPTMNTTHGIRSYNPVFDRYNFLRIREENERERNTHFRRMIENQMETNLRERYNVISFTFRINIANNKLFPEYSTKRTLEEIYWTGVLQRKKDGSLEAVREEKEFEGVLLEQQFFTNTDIPRGQKLVVISPPGLVEHTNYPKNFIDILELKADPRSMQRYIQITRFTSTLSYDDYEEKVTDIDHGYFHGFPESAMPQDAWYLSHPIPLPQEFKNKSADEIYEVNFGGDPKAMKDQDFRNIIMNPDMKMLIAHYTDLISQDQVSWTDVTKAFNAILNFGDFQLKQAKQIKKTGASRHISQREYHEIDRKPGDQLMQFIDYWGNKKVQKVAAGCGSSEGFETRDFWEVNLYKDSLSQYLENSVAKFGVDTIDYKEDPNLCKCGGRDPHFHCPGDNGKCKNVIVVGHSVTSCEKCGLGKTC